VAKSLVIVESPAKAKTIGKFLGKNYIVVASVGHVRDLPKSKMGIDVDNEYQPNYITIRGKGPVINSLKKESKKSKKILLATDPDREGEAISWHLSNILNIGEDEKCRIEFNEITEKAIKNAIKKPRKINRCLVDSQQTRRILDRLVGYSISPLLWRKIRKGLSAGRVQSVVTKIICDREEEINRFVPEEYWSLMIILSLGKENQEFEAKFHGTTKEKIDLNNKEQVDNIIKEIQKDDFAVSDVKRKEKKRNPYPPFTTSSLQQEAANRLGFSTKKTMILSQQLYEGVEIKGEGSIGLITYIRTDSIRISEDAKNEAKEYILNKFNSDYIGIDEKENKSGKSEGAHEAIRPTSLNRSPEAIKESLSNQQYQLYKLIWERFLASQMKNALYDTYSVEIKNKDYVFKASGSKLTFDGFLKVYTYSTVTDNEIPEVTEGQKLLLIAHDPKQHFTQPPPRFTEASLVKELEDKNIGRPSTYAPIISTVLSRGYVEKENKALRPTELGSIVNDLLKEYFESIVDVYFTAELEEQLDQIEEGKLNWVEVIDDFYKPFHQTLKHAEEEIQKIELVEEETDEICEICGKNMVIKYGKFGKFLACSGYPACQHTRPLMFKIGVKCPNCDGDLVERRSKKGRLFYGCGSFPNCNYLSWNQPLDEKCPTCGSLLFKRNKKNNVVIQCSSKECKYKREEERELS